MEVHLAKLPFQKMTSHHKKGSIIVVTAMVTVLVEVVCASNSWMNHATLVAAPPVNQKRKR